MRTYSHLLGRHCHDLVLETNSYTHNTCSKCNKRQHLIFR